MNRCRAGLHVAGNVLVACRRCNNEKRRDDSLAKLVLANSGWESFLSHDGGRCPSSCLTCGLLGWHLAGSGRKTLENDSEPTENSNFPRILPGVRTNSSVRGSNASRRTSQALHRLPILRRGRDQDPYGGNRPTASRKSVRPFFRKDPPPPVPAYFRSVTRPECLIWFSPRVEK